MHTIAAKDVCFGAALKPELKAYQQAILNNAKALANGLLSRGVDLVSGGTDNHLMLVDLRSLDVYKRQGLRSGRRSFPRPAGRLHVRIKRSGCDWPKDSIREEQRAHFQTLRIEEREYLHGLLQEVLGGWNAL